MATTTFTRKALGVESVEPAVTPPPPHSIFPQTASQTAMGGIPMGGMPMGGMPMMAMPMMCHMSFEMTKEGMVCKMTPMDGSGMGTMAERCNAMNAMMAMGMPCMMSCNGMPMMMGMSAGK